MIPDFQTLMRPVLYASKNGEIHIGDVVELLAKEFKLTEEEKSEMLPSGKQARFTNRVHWARSYLKQAGLIKNVKRGHFEITKSGMEALNSNVQINSKFLEKYSEFNEFQNRTRQKAIDLTDTNSTINNQTPDESLRSAYQNINDALAAELLDRIRNSSPDFFEFVIVELLLEMGYGAGEESGHVIGKSGDDGVDGVINQDALGVDQVFIQAKRYDATNKVGPAAIRDFYGALSLKDVSKGIFVTTSSFSNSAIETAQKLGARIVLIDGYKLTRLMIRFEIGCRNEQVIKLAKLDESFFE